MPRPYTRALAVEPSRSLSRARSRPTGAERRGRGGEGGGAERRGGERRRERVLLQRRYLAARRLGPQHSLDSWWLCGAAVVTDLTLDNPFPSPFHLLCSRPGPARPGEHSRWPLAAGDVGAPARAHAPARQPEVHVRTPRLGGLAAWRPGCLAATSGPLFWYLPPASIPNADRKARVFLLPDPTQCSRPGSACACACADSRKPSVQPPARYPFAGCKRVLLTERGSCSSGGGSSGAPGR